MKNIKLINLFESKLGVILRLLCCGPSISFPCPADNAFPFSLKLRPPKKEKLFSWGGIIGSWSDILYLPLW